MAGYPETLDFTGLNTPVGEEYSLTGLSVEGMIPQDVEGAFFRATPDPAFPTFIPDDNILSGDGMISALRISGGKASFDLRYVQTARHRAEVAAGEALFGRYRNPFTDREAAKGIDRTLANTTPVWHAGKLLMTKEDGRPYRINPRTLETLGSYDFDGKLKSDTVTAHVRIDPQTAEMFFYGYEADGLCSTKVAYCIADRNGDLVSEQWFDAPYCAMMHDFTITENYALFPIYPTTADLARVEGGGEHWAQENERESWLGVMPRYGEVAEMRWFRGPKGVFCYHMMNAFEDEAGRIHLDQCLSCANPFKFVQKAGGIDIAPQDMKGALTRWTVDFGGESEDVTETVIGPPGDFPVIPATSQGRPYDRAWMLTMNPEMRGPPIMGGPVYAMFNMLLRLDMKGGPPQALALPQNQCFNEPVHVPSETGEGWLIAFVDTQKGPDEFMHEAWIIDAGNVAGGAIAKIAIPKRQRPQVHGWWVNAKQLAGAL